MVFYFVLETDSAHKFMDETSGTNMGLNHWKVVLVSEAFLCSFYFVLVTDLAHRATG